MPYFQTCLLYQNCKNSFLVLFLSLLPVDSQTSLSSIFSSQPLSPEPVPCPCRPSGPASPAREAGRACCRQEGAAGDSQPSWLQGHGHPVCAEPGEQEPCKRGLIPPQSWPVGRAVLHEPQNLLQVPHATPGYQRRCLDGCSCPPCAAPGDRADSWNPTEPDKHHYYF